MNEPAFSAQLRKEVAGEKPGVYQDAYDFAMLNAETRKYGAMKRDKRNAAKSLKAEKRRLYDEFKQEGKFGFVEWIGIMWTIWSIISAIVEWLYNRNHPEYVQAEFKAYKTPKGSK